MKTKLLKRLRREARDRYPAMPLRRFALLVGWNHEEVNRWVRTERTNYILRRVRELKQKRK